MPSLTRLTVPPARLSSDQDALRELLGPAADMPSPPSPDDRTDESEHTGGIIPGTGRRAEDHEPAPGQGGREPGA